MVNPGVIAHTEFTKILRGKGLSIEKEELDYLMIHLLMCFIYYEWNDKGIVTSEMVKKPIGMSQSSCFKTVNSLLSFGMLTRQRHSNGHTDQMGRPPYLFRFSHQMSYALETAKSKLYLPYGGNVLNAVRSFLNQGSTSPKIKSYKSSLIYNLKAHVLNCVIAANIDRFGAVKYDNYEAMATEAGFKRTNIQAILEQLAKTNTVLVKFGYFSSAMMLGLTVLYTKLRIPSIENSPTIVNEVTTSTRTITIISWFEYSESISNLLDTKINDAGTSVEYWDFFCYFKESTKKRIIFQVLHYFAISACNIFNLSSMNTRLQNSLISDKTTLSTDITKDWINSDLLDQYMKLLLQSNSRSTDTLPLTKITKLFKDILTGPAAPTSYQPVLRLLPIISFELVDKEYLEFAITVNIEQQISIIPYSPT